MKTWALAGLTLALLLGSKVASTQNSDFTKAVELQTAYKEKEALDLFEKVLSKEPGHAEALHRASYLYSVLGNRQEGTEKQKSYYLKAADYAQRSIDAHFNDADAHYALAVALGRISLLSNSEEKLANAHRIKKEAELALSLDQKHAGAYHILGRLNREIAHMPWYKVAAAKALYSGIPEGCTFDKAERYFKAAIVNKPDYILYYYDLALNYEYMGKKEDCARILNIALKKAPQGPDDTQRLKDCRELLAKVSK